MTRKVLYLEEEVKNINENSKTVEVREPFKDNLELKNPTPVSTKKILPVVDKKYFVSKKDQLKCDKCDYKCQKEGTLQKHMNTMHEEHQCKECREKLPSFMDLLKHVSENHFRDQDEQKLNAKKYAA